MLVTITDSLGVNHDVKIRTNVHEITLLNLLHMEKLLAAQPKEVTEIIYNGLQNSEYTMDTAMLFYSFCTDLLEILIEDKKQAHLLNKIKVDDTDSKVNLIGLINIIFNDIFSYKPELINRFVFKNRDFIVPESVSNAFGTTLGRNLTTLQTVLAFELERIYMGVSPENISERFDEDRYKSIIGIVSCICDEIIEDEDGNVTIVELPTNSADREDLLSERIRIFSDLPISTAFNVDFFLLSSNPIFKSIVSINTLSVNLRPIV
jgi:hypothetical protein